MTASEKEELILSHSRATLYLECGLKYKYKYVENRPTKTSIALIFGTAVHAALEANDYEFRDNKKFLPIEQILGIFKKSLLTEALDLYPLPDAEENYTEEEVDGKVVRKKKKATNFKHIDISQKQELSDALKMGAEMIDVYIANVGSRKWYDPLDAEVPLNFSSTRYPVKFRGFIDFISKPGHIVDRKTSKSPYKALKDENGKHVINPKTGNLIFDGPWEKKLQLIMYALWYRTEFKKVEEGLMFDVLVKPMKTLPARVQVLDVIASEQELENSLILLSNVRINIMEELYEAKQGQHCSWCDFRSFCEAIN